MIMMRSVLAGRNIDLSHMQMLHQYQIVIIIKKITIIPATV